LDIPKVKAINKANKPNKGDKSSVPIVEAFAFLEAIL
jgi:hypothetical protein